MGAILGTALSLMLAVGGAAVAAEGGPAAARHYLAGHVILGVGIGLLIATILRAGVRILLARPASQARMSAALPPTSDTATVTVLPVRAAPAVPLRGRHAA
ncbi:hypothetical protein ACFFGR_05190 [Arthrobacter liuii]|uniref:Uncharacterized protein n=1 Tax=Arthrobacter liuii TaxID=1476996 RepID=A0ABQ2ALJ7_9MICC|nr:hypothetical protein [Arthrobacter liuii]GGH91809.1 hypothetical protein GCM10007170_08850 [Arthrobacter liuii]